MATAQGIVKKTALSAFSRPRSNGIIAVDLAEKDNLIGVDITNGERSILLFTDAGKVIRFHESDVRPVGRSARGVRGMKLPADDKLISLIIAPDGGQILTATHNGYGKRTPVDDYPIQGRGGMGVISIQVSERNGKVIGAVEVNDSDEIILISNGGMMVRTRVEEVSVVGRNTQGVRLINLSGDEHLVAVQRIFDLENDQSDQENNQEDNGEAKDEEL